LTPERANDGLLDGHEHVAPQKTGARLGHVEGQGAQVPRPLQGQIKEIEPNRLPPDVHHAHRTHLHSVFEACGTGFEAGGLVDVTPEPKCVLFGSAILKGETPMPQNLPRG